MLTRFLLAIVVVALMVSLTNSATAQDKKKGTKPAAVVLKSVSCDPQCGFMVQSHDEKELTDIVIAHAKNAHNMTVTAADAKAKMKTVTAKENKKTKT
jgi:predicted small metal-binding protein